jgi:integrase/recombinase XerD
MESLAGFAPTVREFLGYLRVEAGLASATLEAYGRDLRQLAEDLVPRGVTAPELVSMQTLAEHLQRLHRERGLEPTTIARHLASIRVYFRYLHANRRVPADPSRLLERPTRWRRLPGVLSPAQMRALVQAPSPEHGELWLRDRTMLELMWAAGLRASEVGALRLNEYHDTLCMLTVTGKGSKQRVVPIGTPAQQLMRQYLAECRPHLTRWKDGRDEYRLLLSFSGRPLERVAVWQIVRKYATIAQLRDVHPHTLRHSFATHLVRGGADLRVVQELLGHADIGTTQIYTHVDRSGLRDVVRKHHPRP